MFLKPWAVTRRRHCQSALQRACQSPKHHVFCRRSPTFPSASLRVQMRAAADEDESMMSSE